jgi:hypothetical protein
MLSCIRQLVTTFVHAALHGRRFFNGLLRFEYVEYILSGIASG